MGEQLSQMKESFANRFEPDGDGYLFRSNLKAPGIRVTAAERDRFVQAYGRRVTILIWVGASATVLVAAAVIWAYVSTSAEMPDWVMWLVLGPCLAATTLLIVWFWSAPNRALRNRMPQAPGRTKDQANAVAFGRMTWPKLGASAISIPVMLLLVSRSSNLLVGWNRLWLMLATALAVLLAVQAFRKWRSGL